MTNSLINEFEQEKEVTFKGENYLVRDNGAVYRFPIEGNRKRPTDCKWTFGKQNNNNAYLHLAGVRVHSIVATAFHGAPPDPQYVVDHIDSNCRNNRPENLRWLTRLENTLKNPTTRKKIEYLCGSIEAFLENPSILKELKLEPNFKWMRAVTMEEAQNCKARMDIWATKENKSSITKTSNTYRKSFEKRVYKRPHKWEVGFGREPGLGLTLTQWCADYMWMSDIYLPCCPDNISEDPIDHYFDNIHSGKMFAYSEHKRLFPDHTITEAKQTKDEAIIILCSRADEKWSLIGVDFDASTHHFIHFCIGNFNDETQARAAFIKRDDKLNFWSDAYNNVCLW